MASSDGALFCDLIHLSDVEGGRGLLWLMRLLGVDVGVGAAFGAIGAERARITHMVRWHSIFLHFVSVMNVLNSSHYYVCVE